MNTSLGNSEICVSGSQCVPLVPRLLRLVGCTKVPSACVVPGGLAGCLKSGTQCTTLVVSLYATNTNTPVPRFNKSLQAMSSNVVEGASSPVLLLYSRGLVRELFK